MNKEFLFFVALLVVLSGCTQSNQQTRPVSLPEANAGDNNAVVPIVSNQPQTGLLPDTSNCASVEDQNEKDDCYNSFALNPVNGIDCTRFALDALDKNSDANYEQTFLACENANIEQSASACARILETTKKDSCYDSISSSRIDGVFVLKDANFCDRIQTSGYKNECYARLTLDESFCEKAEPIVTNDGTFVLKDSCFSEIAEVKKDVSLCEKVDESMSLRDSCYSGVAIAKEDSSICEKINSASYLRGNCFSSIARAKNDVSICGMIQDENAKSDCKASIQP